MKQYQLVVQRAEEFYCVIIKGLESESIDEAEKRIESFYNETNFSKHFCCYEDLTLCILQEIKTPNSRFPIVIQERFIE